MPAPDRQARNWLEPADGTRDERAGVTAQQHANVPIVSIAWHARCLYGRMACTLDAPIPHRNSRVRVAVGACIAGRYRILRHIADGGMGRVFEAEDLLLGGRVALKMIAADPSRHSRAVERFRREIQLARKITHPNVCRVFDVAFHQDSPVLTMELLAGETLTAYLRTRTRLPPHEVLAIAEQLAAAIDTAHAAGVVHRDLKCQNVMLVPEAGTDKARAVITDFGLAVLDSNEQSNELPITQEGAFVGTLAYMAPEQLDGAPITRAVDIYAFGIVLYELLTGATPFTATTPLGAAKQRLLGAPAITRANAPGIPAHWSAVISRCLACEPQQRFANAHDVVCALTNAPRARPRTAIAVALCAVALAVGVAASLHAAAPGPQAHREQPIKTAEQELADAAAAMTAGDALRQEQAATRAAVLAKLRGSAKLEAQAEQLRGLALTARSRYAEARAALQRSRERFDQEGDREGSITSSSALGSLHITLGELASARRELARVADWYQQTGAHDRRAWTLPGIAFAAVAIGDVNEAERLYEEAGADAARSNDRALRGYVATGLAEARLARGDVASAVKQLDAAVVLAASAGDPNLQWWTHLVGGSVRMAQGDFAAARTACARSATLANHAKLTVAHALSELCLAELAIETGSAAAGVATARRVRDRLEALGVPTASARVVLARGLLLQHRFDEARTELASSASEDVNVVVQAAIASAFLRAERERSATAAVTELDQLRHKLASSGLERSALELDIGAGELERRWGSDAVGRRRLDAAARAATRHGLARAARRAQRARS